MSRLAFEIDGTMIYDPQMIRAQAVKLRTIASRPHAESCVLLAIAADLDGLAEEIESDQKSAQASSSEPRKDQVASDQQSIGSKQPGD